MIDYTIVVIPVLKTFSFFLLLLLLFFIKSYVYSIPLFLISSASVRSILPVLYSAHLCMKFPLISLIFLKRSLAFHIQFFPSFAFHCSLKKAFFFFWSPCSFWNSALRWVCLSLSPLLFTYLLFSALCKVSSDNNIAFLYFFFFGMVLITTSCSVSSPISNSSGPLSFLIP